MLLPIRRSRLTGYLIAATCSRTGDEMTAPALLLLALMATAGSTSGPLLVAALTAASAVGGPVLGALLDRSLRPYRMLAVALAGFAVLLAVTGVLLGAAPLAVCVGAAALAGLLRPALAGGWSSRLPELLDRSPAGSSAPPPGSEVPTGRAIALDGVSFDVATLIGPALVGLLAVGAGRGWALTAAVMLILLGASMAWRIGGTAPAVRPQLGTPRPTVLAGLRALLSIPPLRRATAVSVISYVGVGMLTTSVPELGRAVLGAADRGPMILPLVALAALVANAVYARHPRVHPETVLTLSTALMGVALALTAAVVAITTAGGLRWWPVLVLGVAMAIIGSGDGPQLVALMRIRHRETPERVRSQVFTTGASLKLGGLALGAAVSAPLLAWTLPAALLAAAGCQLVAVVVALRR